MRVHHHAQALVAVLEGGQTVGVGALAADKTIAACGLGKQRIGAQLKTALLGQSLSEQGFDARAVAPEQVKHKALKVGGLGDVHGRAAGFMRVGGAAHTVDPRMKELIEHIVLVGGNHQLRNGQAHHAGHMASADIAKIAARHGEAHLLGVGLRGLEIAGKVVNHLGHQTRPVNGVDSANFVFSLEVQVVGDGLDHVLAVVKHAVYSDVVDVVIQ